MKTIAERIQEGLTIRHMKQADLVRLTGIGKSSISTYLSGEYEPKQRNIYKIAKALNVSEAWLLGQDVPMERNQSIPEYTSDDLIPYKPTKRIPILGYISAGLPLYAEEHIEGYTFTDLNGGYEYFALRVTGDSMNAARIFDNDLLIVRKQNFVENGEIAVVMVDGENATVKRFFKEEHIITLMPQSTNPIHQPQIYNAKNTEIKIIGKVVKNEINFD